jgi:hypothetical protein
MSFARFGKEQMMHPILPRLAEHFGVRLEDRSCFRNHVYNPKKRSIALRGRERKFSDHDLLHEIVHFALASEKQRRFPEYGLGYAAIDWEWWDIPGCMSLKDANIQERMVSFLCIRWGMAYGISPELSMSPGRYTSWEQYLIAKTQEEPHDDAWLALFALQDWLQLPIPC